MAVEAVNGGMRVQRVWDLPTRLFHWINFAAVLVLVGDGLILMKLGALGIRPPAALLFKQIHVWTGYVFAANLAWRIVWACCGSPSARWSALLPTRRGLRAALMAEWRDLRDARRLTHAGHSQGGRLAIVAMLFLLALLALTGLVLAGTDIYYPPFGRYFAAWVAAPGVDPAQVVPYEPQLVTVSAFYEVRAFRRPFIVVHKWSFYVLAALIVIHIAAVIASEVRTGGALVSAMITGAKFLPREQPLKAPPCTNSAKD